MTSPNLLNAFVRGAFQTVWALELLLHLRRSRERAWTVRELVEALRGSDILVRNSLDGLARAGLVRLHPDGAARFHCAKVELDALTAQVAELYDRRPDTVRRQIVRNVQHYCEGAGVSKGGLRPDAT